MELQGGGQIVKTILKKTDKAGRITYLNFKAYYKATKIKTVIFFFCNQNKNRCWQGCGATGIVHFANRNLKGAATIEKFGSSSIS